jgi:hypothetical protein
MDAGGSMIVRMTNDHLPDNVLPVDPEFATQYARVTSDGAIKATDSTVAIVGLARNLGDLLPETMRRIYETAYRFADFRIIIVENDSTDGTKQQLAAWAQDDPEHVIVQVSDTGRPQLRGFEAARMQAMAEYRNRCHDLVAEHYPQADYVIVVDMDAWGGWSVQGVLNGIGWHELLPQAGGLMSVSLFKHPGILVGGEVQWCHYDQFAFRWYGWHKRLESWFSFWLPPPGVEPLIVNSAFGGLGIYKTAAYLSSRYSSPDGDCEHVHFHRMMKGKGWSMHLNPAQRCVMSWLVDEEPSNAAEPYIDDQHRTVSA